MSTDRSTDDRISAWLHQEAPDQLPAQVLNQAFERTRATRQARGLFGPGRISFPVSQRWVLITLALLGAMAALVAAGAWRQDRPGPLGGNGRIAYDADWRIFSLAPDGSDRRQLTTGSNDLWPIWSPDGSKLAFYRSPTQVPPPDPDQQEFISGVSVWVTDADGSAAVNVTGNTPIDIDDGWRIAWAPAGDQVAFASGSDDGDSVVYVANADGTGLVQITERSLYASGPAWAPDGTTVAVRGGLYDTERAIYLVNADGSGTRRLTSEQHDFNRHSLPTWSPDGTKLLFYAGTAGAQDVWVVNIDGSDEHPLMRTGFPYDEIWPRWSPDGLSIAFVRLDHREETGTVYLMNGDGSDLRPVSEPRVDGPPEWSPDGTRIVARLCPTEDAACGPNDAWDIVLLDPAAVEAPRRIGTVNGLGLLSWQRLEQ